MKIAVWETSHEISQTVSRSLAKGFNATLLNTADCTAERIAEYDCHIAYGILRGTSDVFRHADAQCLPWFNADRGYFSPAHYDGYYRLSFRGTQAKWHIDGPKRQHSLELEPWQTKLGRVMICPPTEHVRQFYKYPYQFAASYDSHKYNGHFYRFKGDASPIDWNEIAHVITFNSSLGWEALRRGIPVISDPLHSVVGSYQATKSIDTWDRDELFNFMAGHDFTLPELERGQALPALHHYLSRL